MDNIIQQEVDILFSNSFYRGYWWTPVFSTLFTLCFNYFRNCL